MYLFRKGWFSVRLVCRGMVLVSELDGRSFVGILSVKVNLEG